MTHPPQRVAVIINPISGAGRRRDVARRRAELAASLIEQRRLDAEVFVTECQGHARELTQAALRRGVTLVIAWGGDGTVNEVASALVHSSASMAIVPSGSGNGLARELDIPFDPAGAFEVALHGQTRLVDAGELDGRLFFNVAGVGLDARIAHRFAEGGLARRGFARYLELAAREALIFKAVEHVITIDGESTRVRPLIIAIANGRQYGSGALIAPHARIDDGRLEVVVVSDRSWWSVLWHTRSLFSGALAHVPGVSMTAAVTVEISSTTPLAYHVDGEPHMGGPSVKARVRPAALRVLTGIRSTTNHQPEVTQRLHHARPVQRYRSISMYARMFKKAGQTKRFTITDAGTAGWEVREEQDSQVVRTARYTDWHRVERARMTFALEAATLADSGWKES